MIEQLWELQTKQAELRRHVVQLSNQINSEKRERQSFQIAVDEMDRLAPDTSTYRAIGKMFVLQDPKELREALVEAGKASEKRDESRQMLRDQFVTKLKDTEEQADQLAVTMQKSSAFGQAAK